MPQMEALRDFPFAGRKVKAGESITATDREADTLRKLQWAKPVRVYSTRDQVAEDSVDDSAPGGRKPRDPNKTARRYKRRDMQAEA